MLVCIRGIVNRPDVKFPEQQKVLRLNLIDKQYFLHRK